MIFSKWLYCIFIEGQHDWNMARGFNRTPVPGATCVHCGKRA